MPTKNFERALKFTKLKTRGGPRWFPIIRAYIMSPHGTRRALPMLFDTGSPVTILDAQLAYYVGLSDWTQGQRDDLGGVGAQQTEAYRVDGVELQLLGKTLNRCSVYLTRLPQPDVIKGILGRNVFWDFGFGFWECARTLFVSLNP